MIRGLLTCPLNVLNRQLANYNNSLLKTTLVCWQPKSIKTTTATSNAIRLAQEATARYGLPASLNSKPSRICSCEPFSEKKTSLHMRFSFNANVLSHCNLKNITKFNYTFCKFQINRAKLNEKKPKTPLARCELNPSLSEQFLLFSLAGTLSAQQNVLQKK